MIKLTPISKYDPFEHKPADWPDKSNFVNPHDVRREQFEGLRALVDAKAGERELERFFSQNPEVMALFMSLFSTGHHASWIYAKQQIAVPSSQSTGLIPDYILAGANSDGVTWFILELKGVDQNAFVSRDGRVILSSEASAGICQLTRYIDESSRSQSYLRDVVGLTGFREPRGILLIGNSEESTIDEIRNFKGAWNRTNPRLLIRSYDALLRQVEAKVLHREGAISK